MGEFFLVLSIVVVLLSLLPFIPNQHWVFRVPEFLSLQLLILHIAAIVGLGIFTDVNTLFWIVFLLQVALIIYHFYLFFRYTKFYKKRNIDVNGLKEVKIISANIYQFNKQFERFNDFIRKENPDIFLTIESNSDWEEAMRVHEKDYPHTQKITLENTYGMHLYSKIPFKEIEVHYFVADDVPSIEAHFKNENDEDFAVFFVHPPPPSPTEEANSKERDGDLLCVAKKVKEFNKPTLVIGDFNTVAWSNISKLFRKNSGLIDGRHGRGILASFHAKYWFFRAPLDLVYHSPNMFLKELDVLENVGSDHFPICCVICIDPENDSQEDEVEDISHEESQETEEIIDEGKEEESEKR